MVGGMDRWKAVATATRNPYHIGFGGNRITTRAFPVY